MTDCFEEARQLVLRDSSVTWALASGQEVKVAFAFPVRAAVQIAIMQGIAPIPFLVAGDRLLLLLSTLIIQWEVVEIAVLMVCWKMASCPKQGAWRDCQLTLQPVRTLF